MRNYLNNLSVLYAITYFTLSDLSNPIVSLKHPFQGADGLFTFNGLKEASATALSFIGKLGGMTMAFAKNFIVTKEGENHHSRQQLLSLLQAFCTRRVL
ncbi:MAG: hypothetical protein PUE07_04425 [bacterium]|nr:hypothetical protein [bacterium]